MIGGVGGLLTVLSLFASIAIPTWGGVAIVVVALAIAQFRAFNDMRRERNAARDELRRSRTPLSGHEFKGQTLSFNRIAHDLGHGGVLNGFRFDECKIVGPGVFGLLEDITFTNNRWLGRRENMFVAVPNGTPQIAGTLGLIDCVFTHCTFEGIGLMGTADARQKWAVGTKG